ncbi:MAG: hypothetical protein SFU86_13040 [Pirellulaceae bacterium]|nr:hypothetical protein [Pirellulaceae bacterium]
MIRTTLSFCALFASLILVSKWLYESGPVEAPTAPALAIEPAATPASAAPAAIEVVPAQPMAPAASESTEQPAADPLAILRLNERAQYRLVSFEDGEATADENAPPEPERKTDEAPAEETAPDSSPARPRATSEVSDSTTDPTETTSENTPADSTTETEPKSASDEAKPAEPQLSPELEDLRSRLRECLAWYYFRPENVATRSPWGAMHAMIAYGVDSQLIVNGNRVNAIGYLNYNGVCNGQNLFYLRGGKIHAQIGVGVQGHAGQYLAMLAQSRVKKDFPMHIEGREFTVADLIEHEKETCRPASELTFKLIALSHYLKSDEKWVSNDGQDWDIPRLIKEELKQPINGAACGGTHRLTGLSYAVRKRELRKEPIEGQWKRAQKYIDDYHEYTFKLQNPNGSMSTEWFVVRADFGDIARRVQTTGHITEWLAFSLSKEQLTEPRMVKSVRYLTEVLLDNRHEKWSIGPLGHALHALAIYDERVFAGKPGEREAQLAEVRKQFMSR